MNKTNKMFRLFLTILILNIALLGMVPKVAAEEVNDNNFDVVNIENDDYCIDELGELQYKPNPENSTNEILSLKSSPAIQPLNNGLGIQDTIAVEKTATRRPNECRNYDVKLKITGEQQPIPVDVVIILDKSGSMNETGTQNLSDYTKINQNPSTSNRYWVKVSNKFYEVNYRHLYTFTYGWIYTTETGETRYVSYDSNGSDNGQGGTSYSNRVYKPFYTTTKTRMYFAKEAAKAFSTSVLGDGNPLGNRVSIVSFNGPDSVEGFGYDNQATINISLTTNLANVISSIQGITAINGTNTEAGFKKGEEAIRHQSNPDSNKVVIMFTDGLPTASTGYKYAETTDITHPHITRAIAAGKRIFQNGYADVFTIGLLEGMTNAQRDLALHILQNTQNKGWFEAPTAEALGDIFDAIFQNLGFSAKNAIVTDKIGQHFELVPGSLPSGVDYNEATKTITWNAGTIVDNKEISYIVRANDNFSGKAFTNEFAKLNYKDVFGNNKELSFERPEVDVPTLLNLELTDTEIILGDSINLGSGTNPSGENYMGISGGDGNGTYIYEWRIKGSSNVLSTLRNPSVSPTETTEYDLKITDSNNCVAFATMKVTVRKLNLKITKKVEGNFADLSKSFNFTVTLDGVNVPGTISLKNGEHYTINNISKGSVIRITEANGEYDVVYTINETTVSENEIYEFTMEGGDVDILVTNTYDIIIETNVRLDTIPYMIIITISFIGLAYVLKTKKEYN